MGVLSPGQQVPVRNASDEAIDRLALAYIYGLEEADERDPETPLTFLAVPDGVTDGPYGPLSSNGLWPFPRMVGMADARIGPGELGSLRVDAAPRMAKVRTLSVDLTDTDDPRAVGPLLGSAALGVLTPMFVQSLEREDLSESRVSQAVTHEVYATYAPSSVGAEDPAHVSRATSLWHNLGAVRELDSQHWLCCVAPMIQSVLRGITRTQCAQFGLGEVDLIAGLGSGLSGTLATSNIRTPYRIRAVRNDYATVTSNRFVQLAFVDGWWYLTAAEC